MRKSDLKHCANGNNTFNIIPTTDLNTNLHLTLKLKMLKIKAKDNDHNG